MVCSTRSPRDGQHHIAYLSSQRCPAIDRIPAKDPFEGYLVPGISVFECDTRCENEDEKLSFSVDPDIVGTKLSGHSDHAVATGGNALHQVRTGDHRKHIYSGGQTGDLQHESVEASSVVFMREFRCACKRPSDSELIRDMFHGTTS